MYRSIGSQKGGGLFDFLGRSGNAVEKGAETCVVSRCTDAFQGASEVMKPWLCVFGYGFSSLFHCSFSWSLSAKSRAA